MTDMRVGRAVDERCAANLSLQSDGILKDEHGTRVRLRARSEGTDLFGGDGLCRQPRDGLFWEPLVRRGRRPPREIDR